MSKKVPYSCDELEGKDLLECRDFTPSGTTDKRGAYKAKQKECKDLADAGDEKGYKAAGCKREGHIMVPEGRGALRYGYPEPRKPDWKPAAEVKELYPAGKPYVERLTAIDPFETPLTARTQSQFLFSEETRLRAEKAQRRKKANDRMIEALKKEAQREVEEGSGLPQVPLVPGKEMGWLEQLIREEKDPGVRKELRRRRRSLQKRLKGRRKTVEADPERMRRGTGMQLPAVAYDAGLLKALGKQLGGPIAFEPTGFGDVNSTNPKSPIGILGPTGQVRPGGKRIETLSSGGKTVEIRELLRRFMLKLSHQPGLVRALTRPGEGRGQQAAARAMRKWLLQNPGPEVVVGLSGGKVVRIPWSKLQHSIVSPKADKRGPPDYKRLRNLTIEDLPEASSYIPKKKRRGRRLRKLRKARTNPMTTYFINPEDYTNLEPGDYVELPSRPGKVVYKNSKGELKVTTESRAIAWKEYGAVAKEMKPLAKVLRKDEDVEVKLKRSRINRKEPHMARRKKSFDPLGELMKEFGPTARRGKKIRSGAPKRGGGYSVGPFGARSSIPINRRNPKKRKSRKSRKPSEWNVLFGKISRRASEIQHRKGCSYKKAFDDARYEIAPNYHAKAARRNKGPQWEQDLGPYLDDRRYVPANRRNPKRAGKILTARFPAECAVCGREFQSGVSQIADSGHRGPRGGKKYAHVECI